MTAAEYWAREVYTMSVELAGERDAFVTLHFIPGNGRGRNDQWQASTAVKSARKKDRLVWSYNDTPDSALARLAHQVRAGIKEER